MDTMYGKITDSVLKEQSLLKEKQHALDEKLENNENIAREVLNTLKKAVVSPSKKTPEDPGKSQAGSDEAIYISKEDYNLLSNQVNSMLKNLAELKNEAQLIKNTLSSLTDMYEELSQYMRRNNLLFHGLRLPGPKVKGYAFIREILRQINTLLRHKLDQPLTWEDIDIAHPLPTSKNKKSCVIVRFVRRFTALEVFKVKRWLKGTGVTITEHLTKKNLELLDKSRAATDFRRAWSVQGKVFIIHNKVKIHIKSEAHLMSLGDISKQTLFEEPHFNHHDAVSGPSVSYLPPASDTNNFNLHQHNWSHPSQQSNTT